MRTPTLAPLSAPRRRSTALAILSLALAAGLAGCDGAGPTGPDVAPSVDPVPLAQDQPSLPSAAARTSTEASRTVVLPVCPIWRWPRGKLGPGADDLQICATAASAAKR